MVPTSIYFDPRQGLIDLSGRDADAELAVNALAWERMPERTLFLILDLPRILPRTSPQKTCLIPTPLQNFWDFFCPPAGDVYTGDEGWSVCHSL